MASDKRIEDLIMITGRLINTLQRENDALRNHRVTDVQDMLDGKMALGRLYESRMKAIIEHPELLDGINEKLRKKFDEFCARVNTLVEENGKLLKLEMRISQKVVDLIAEAVRDATPNAGTYGANGCTESGDIEGDKRRAAFSLNQVL